jgi:HEPN domain-containing protein
MSPSKQERLFDKSYAEELLKISSGDLATAEALLNLSGIRIENAFYHVQQSIEKALKSVLIHNQIAVPLVHDLGILMAKIPQRIESPYGYELQQLNEFATIRRYQEGEVVLTKQELEETILIGKNMLIWAEKCLKIEV